MHMPINQSDLPVIKKSLRLAHPAQSPSRRMEAAARALGFHTYGGLRQALEAGITAQADDATFCEWLGVPAAGDAGDPDRSLSRAVARAALHRVLDAQPGLTQRGFDSPWQGTRDELAKPTPERQVLFEDRRREAYDDDWSADQFELAMIYLSRQRKIATINRKIGSYSLKHRAEGLSRNFNLFTELGNYVSNGMLIAAAYASGFTVRPIAGHYNAHFNISMQTVNQARGLSGRTRSEARSIVVAMYKTPPAAPLA